MLARDSSIWISCVLSWYQSIFKLNLSDSIVSDIQECQNVTLKFDFLKYFRFVSIQWWMQNYSLFGFEILHIYENISLLTFKAKNFYKLRSMYSTNFFFVDKHCVWSMRINNKCLNILHTTWNMYQCMENTQFVNFKRKHSYIATFGNKTSREKKTINAYWTNE